MLDVPMLPNSAKTNRGTPAGPSQDKVAEDRAAADTSDFEAEYAQEASEPQAAAGEGETSDKPKSDESPVAAMTDPKKTASEEEPRLGADDDMADLGASRGVGEKPDTSSGLEASTPKDIPQRKAPAGTSEVAFQNWLLQTSGKVDADHVRSVTTPDSGAATTTPSLLSASGSAISTLQNGAAGDMDTQAITLAKSVALSSSAATTSAKAPEQGAAGFTNPPMTAPAQTHPAVQHMAGIPTKKIAAEQADERLIHRSISAETATDSPKPTEPKPAPIQPPGPSLPIQGTLTALTVDDPSSSDLKPLIDGPFETATSWEAKSQAPASLSQVMARAETPGMIGRQIAEAFHRMSDKPMELALNPQELGRVKLSISASELGITVSVLAERPETLDLMRRNIDQLAREFQMIGYENINFAFSEGRSDHSQEQSEKAQEPSRWHGIGEDRPDQTATPKTINLSTATGLDLRL